MTVCDLAISPECPGHEGWQKFADCLTEALYSAGDDGSTGNVDNFGWHISLIVQDMAETIDAAYDDVKITIPAGTYCLIRTNDQGHVYRDTYDTAEDAQAAFDDWESRYGDYLAGLDAREYAIVSSTGRIGS